MSNPAPTPTILVVDDDQGLLVLIGGALREEKWNVATAASGADALAWLQKNSADLLLLDLKLRDIEGREFICAMSDTGRSIPFIVITGQGDERVAVEMMKRGALDYLVKDVNFIEFVPAVVRRAFDQLARSKRLTEAEESLRESEARFRLMADHAPVLIWMSGPDKLCTWFNRPWMEFTGRSLEQELGNGWAEGVHPDDLARCLDIYGKAVDAQRPFAMEYRLRRHDGEWRWLHDQGIPLRSAAGKLTGYIGSCIDITERKRLEQELLEVSEREQRKFGHDLHDGLGQRLTGLEMFSHGLAEDLKEHTPALAKQARRLNRELRETVTQARLISHSLAPVRLEGDGLMQGLSELAASTSRIPGVKCQFLCDPPVCIQDVTTATHLYRIAQEAVNNALKHGRAKKLEITLTKRAQGVQLSVDNDGRSLPSAKSASSGMGLNVMRYRAEMIGASLSIESGKRKGVRVNCTLHKKT